MLMLQEEMKWAQKARNKRIVLGDKNTRYFQTFVKQKMARNRILHIKTSDGNVSENPSVIEQTLLNHFRQSYEDTVNIDFSSILEELNSIPLPKLSS